MRMTDLLRSLRWPQGRAGVFAAMLSFGLLLLYLPTFYDLATTLWKGDEQGHGPIILALSGWFLWRKSELIVALPSAGKPVLGLALLAVAMVLYAFGRSQAILMFEVGSGIPALAALLLMARGWPAIRLCWFPLFFLIFMVPLPDVLVSSLTTPLKSLVSAAATALLGAVGYPVARAGVVISVGQYQLLVADACAGLNSLFTLEALGLVYMQLMNYTAPGRNIFLALVLLPISILANITRVVILILVTYHFGDEAGQGFVHGFAGMVLFLVALSLMLVVDQAWGLGLRFWQGHRARRLGRAV